nr:putative ribonuclease H-like domain-containing protein [Tanacetum cinerariifolium]
MTHPNPQRHVVPIAVLTRSRIVPLSAARPVNTAVPQTKVHHQRPVTHDVYKPYSPLKRHINHRPSPPASNFHQKVTTAKAPQVNSVKGVKGNWGEKITGKGKIRTGKLDFDDVYFVKELKFNLFSVSQMCDKKNNVLFTDTKCIVLSSDFKLPDENHVLLREERSNSVNDNIIYELPACSAITPNEPVDSLSMEDEHLDTVPATKSDEFIMSSVGNLVPNPSESEGENECDMPAS